jgi:VanZ family protein
MRTSFWLRSLPPLFWAAAIFYLSSQSRPLGRRWPSLPSALAHVFEFAVLAALLHRALATDPQRRQRAVAPAFVLTALYAASDEVHQLFVPERTASLAEYGLDLLGTLAGLSVRQWWVQRHRKEGA